MTDETNSILDSLTVGAKKVTELEGVVNIQRSRITAFLKILEKSFPKASGVG